MSCRPHRWPASRGPVPKVFSPHRRGRSVSRADRGRSSTPSRCCRASGGRPDAVAVAHERVRSSPVPLSASPSPSYLDGRVAVCGSVSGGTHNGASQHSTCHARPTRSPTPPPSPTSVAAGSTARSARGPIRRSAPHESRHPAASPHKMRRSASYGTTSFHACPAVRRTYRYIDLAANHYKRISNTFFLTAARIGGARQ